MKHLLILLFIFALAACEKNEYGLDYTNSKSSAGITKEDSTKAQAGIQLDTTHLEEVNVPF